MKYLLVNGNKVEATKGIKGICLSFGLELIAKCEEYMINH